VEGLSVPDKRGRLKSNFNLGGEQAEADQLLKLAFYESSDYSAITSKYDSRCFLIGRTGSGKSPALQHLEESRLGKVVRIDPEDLSLPYIVDLQVIKYLDSLDINLDLLFIALWKHVLLVELVRHRYNVDSPVAKQNFLSALRDRIKRDPGKAAALQYLDEFGEKFWCEADERVREIAERRRTSRSSRGFRSPAASMPGPIARWRKLRRMWEQRLARSPLPGCCGVRRCSCLSRAPHPSSTSRRTRRRAKSCSPTSNSSGYPGWLRPAHVQPFQPSGQPQRGAKLAW
jgi:hypothetical protein